MSNKYPRYVYKEDGTKVDHPRGYGMWENSVADGRIGKPLSKEISDRIKQCCSFHERELARLRKFRDNK